LRNALLLLEEFIKDIIHDLNTPITSILINLKMMQRSEEVESIAQSAKTISMLHKNLEVYLKGVELQSERCKIREIVDEQVSLFYPIYDYLEWHMDIGEQIVISNRNALSRIIYNLISNACKYNRPDGYIQIEMAKGVLTISNSSYGVKNPSKVFDRFYKEGSRGLGIGLHIVDKLCKELEIDKKFEVKGDEVRVILYFRSN
jgi:signal transduction histidine kinase